MQPFKIDTQLKGVFVVSEESIVHRTLNKEETSPGLLVKKHFQEVHHALYCAWIIREGKTEESIRAYFHSEEDLKDAPPLERVVAALEKQIDLLTEGNYNKYASSVGTGGRIDDYRYSQEIYDIFSEIKDLKTRRYYENEIHHRPGVPIIETIGKRLLDEIMLMIWRMDNGAPGLQEEISEAFTKFNNEFWGEKG